MSKYLIEGTGKHIENVLQEQRIRKELGVITISEFKDTDYVTKTKYDADIAAKDALIAEKEATIAELQATE